MNKKIVCGFISLFFLLSLSISLFSCIESPKQANGGDGEKESETEFVPSAQEEDRELSQRYNEYKENSTLAFTNNQPASMTDFTLENTDGGVAIAKYIGKSDIVVIPHTLGEQAVVSILKGAFEDATVRAVSVPDSVKIIEDGAFAGCKSLVTLRVPFVGNGVDKTFFSCI